MRELGKDQTGSHSGFTGLYPIRLPSDDPSATTPLVQLRSLLRSTNRYEDSPFAQVHGTYFVRFTIIEDVVCMPRRSPISRRLFNQLRPRFAELDGMQVVAGRGEGRIEHLQSPYLLFCADLWGEVGDWVQSFWGQEEPFARSVFENCWAFDNITTGHQFASYVLRGQIGNGLLFNGSNDDDPVTQLKALHVKQTFSDFVARNQHKKPEELRRAFLDYQHTHQPALDFPRWRPGASTLERIVDDGSPPERPRDKP